MNKKKVLETGNIDDLPECDGYSLCSVDFDEMQNVTIMLYKAGADRTLFEQLFLVLISAKLRSSNIVCDPYFPKLLKVSREPDDLFIDFIEPGIIRFLFEDSHEMSLSFTDGIYFFTELRT